ARPRREVSVGAANHLAVTGFRLMPAVFDRLVTPLMRAGGISRSETANSPGNVLEPQPTGDALHGRWGRHWMRPVAALAATATLAVTTQAVRATRASRSSRNSTITRATRKKLQR
ncbi:MAG: hypothetical protein WB473_03900, partial [Pedococcus sp.]